MKKLTINETELLLCAFAGGQLGASGYWMNNWEETCKVFNLSDNQTGCINQILYNCPNPMEAFGMNKNLARIYDNDLNPVVYGNKKFPKTPESFIRWLNKRGLL